MTAQSVWIRTFAAVVVLVVAVRAFGYGTTALLAGGLVLGILTGRWMKARET